MALGRKPPGLWAGMIGGVACRLKHLIAKTICAPMLKLLLPEQGLGVLAAEVG